jgi:hypothetical protein
MAGGLGDNQHDHWQHTYAQHPHMYGEAPSSAAVAATAVFTDHAVQQVHFRADLGRFGSWSVEGPRTAGWVPHGA